MILFAGVLLAVIFIMLHYDLSVDVSQAERFRLIFQMEAVVLFGTRYERNRLLFLILTEGREHRHSILDFSYKF